MGRRIAVPRRPIGIVGFWAVSIPGRRIIGSGCRQNAQQPENRRYRHNRHDSRLPQAPHGTPRLPPPRKPSAFRPRHEPQDRGGRYDWKNFLKSQAALTRNLLADSSSDTTASAEARAVWVNSQGGPATSHASTAGRLAECRPDRARAPLCRVLAARGCFLPAVNVRLGAMGTRVPQIADFRCVLIATDVDREIVWRRSEGAESEPKQRKKHVEPRPRCLPTSRPGCPQPARRTARRPSRAAQARG
jgi:hypothetical protein